MNIMLVSVRERTREIGLCQAVGAKTRDILTQFLVEAITLAIVGGVIGILLGITASAMISRIATWQTSVGAGGVLLAVLFSAMVGISVTIPPAKPHTSIRSTLSVREIGCSTAGLDKPRLD